MADIARSVETTPVVAEAEAAYRRLLRVVRAARGMFALVVVESGEEDREVYLERLRKDLGEEGLQLRPQRPPCSGMRRTSSITSRASCESIPRRRGGPLRPCQGTGHVGVARFGVRYRSTGGKGWDSVLRATARKQ